MPDGHVSRLLRGRWLSANAPGRVDVFDDRSERNRPPWSAADLGGRPPEVTWRDLQSRGRVVSHRSRCTPAHRSVAGAGRAQRAGHGARGGVVVWLRVCTTNYGDLFDVRVEPRPVNLGVHGPCHRTTTRTTRTVNRRPGSNCSIACSRRPAGERTSSSMASPRPVVIGDQDPQAFTTLTSTPLTFRYEDADTLLRASGPIITLNPGAVTCGRSAGTTARRASDRSRRMMFPRCTGRCGASLWMLERPNLHLHVTFEPGECIVFDNTLIPSRCEPCSISAAADATCRVATPISTG